MSETALAEPSYSDETLEARTARLARDARIRAEYSAPCPHCGARPKQVQIAKRHGVSQASVSQILKRGVSA